VLAVLDTAVIVAYPIAIALLFVVVEWTGCFIECRAGPEPLGGCRERAGCRGAADASSSSVSCPGVAPVAGCSSCSVVWCLLTAAMWVLGVTI
jgi:hypothetical protein